MLNTIDTSRMARHTWGMKRKPERRLDAEAMTFIAGGGNPASLIHGDRDLFSAVLRLIENDPPKRMAITDPAMYRALRRRITELRIQGWGIG